jgi:hypothetical protein
MTATTTTAAPTVFTPALVTTMAGHPLEFARKDLAAATAKFARNAADGSATSLLWAADVLNEVAEASAKVEVYEWVANAYADPAKGATFAARLRKLARIARAEVCKVAESAAHAGHSSASVANSLEASKAAGRARAWVRTCQETAYLVDGMDDGTVIIDESAPADAA